MFYLLHSVDIVFQFRIKEHILKCIKDLFICILFGFLSSAANMQVVCPLPLHAISVLLCDMVPD